MKKIFILVLGLLIIGCTGIQVKNEAQPSIPKIKINKVVDVDGEPISGLKIKSKVEYYGATNISEEYVKDFSKRFLSISSKNYLFDSEIKELILKNKQELDFESDENGIIKNSIEIPYGDYWNTKTQNIIESYTVNLNRYYSKIIGTVINATDENKYYKEQVFDIDSDKNAIIVKSRYDYFKKEFLSKENNIVLRDKITLFLDNILVQSYLKSANLPYRSIGIYEFKNDKYIELNLNSTVVYNSLKSDKYDIGKNLFGELVVKILDSLVMIEDENISGVNLRVTGYTKSFAEEYASNTAIKYDFIMKKETIRKYKDKDITSQKLLDDSVILMDNERIELKLQ